MFTLIGMVLSYSVMLIMSLAAIFAVLVLGLGLVAIYEIVSGLISFIKKHDKDAGDESKK